MYPSNHPFVPQSPRPQDVSATEKKELINISLDQQTDWSQRDGQLPTEQSSGQSAQSTFGSGVDHFSCRGLVAKPNLLFPIVTFFKGLSSV